MFWDWLASPLIWDDGDISLTHQGVVCFWWSLQVSEDSSTTCLFGDKTTIQYRYQGHPAMKWPSGDNLFMNWEAHKMSTIGQPTAVPSIHPTPRQILGSLQHAPMLPSTFDHCWPPCASNSELPEPDMLAAHSHLCQRLCDLMWSTFQCHKGPVPPAVCIHHTFASVILVQGCQAFIAWEGVTWMCSGGWAMGPVGRDYPEGQRVVLHNHSIHHHNPIWHCSGLINSHEKCHHPQDCPWNRHRFQLGDLALRSCWCVGWSGESIQVLIQVFKRVQWRRRTEISRPLCCVVHIKRFSQAIPVTIGLHSYADTLDCIASFLTPSHRSPCTIWSCVSFSYDTILWLVLVRYPSQSHRYYDT